MAQWIQGRNWMDSEILYLLQRIDGGYLPTLEEKRALREWTYLDLSGTKITALPDSIRQLANLQILDLSGTKITALRSSIGQLANLKYLRLRKMQITALPDSIGWLSKLRNLDLLCTNITALPESIGQLENLQTLNLWDTPVTDLPDSIGQLKNLQTLDLNYTRITTLPETVGQLKNLQTLHLPQGRITALPESIGGLASLKELSLWSSPINTLPESVVHLKSLQKLQLCGTKISALPDSIGSITNLQWVDLTNTQITALPESIGKLPYLRHLDLTGLTLTGLPRSLATGALEFVRKEFFSDSDKGINLYNVTLTEQDISIFLEHPELISSLYEEKMITLRECRVIFLGDGASGKSYTIKRFRNDGKKETKKDPYTTSETPGVEILDYPVGSGAEAFTIHFWDFGGQQLLHSMHRCFLTDETCYVVTVKTRETKANERARYWLRNVRAFAPKSPILLFVNCWENDDGRRSIDEPGLRKEFPLIQNVVYCSAKQAEKPEFRKQVMKPIIDMAAASEGIARKVPAPWVRVREAIEAESKANNYLDRARYHALCKENGIQDEQAPELLSFFNNLGVCFSFHRDREKKELADYKLLNPVWLTNAIYAVIEEGRIHAKEGRISREEIGHMLCNRAPDTVYGKQYRRTAPELVYQPMECPFILDVAIAYDLCYRIDKKALFLPALCGADTPAEALSDPEGFGQHVSYLLRYTYLPDSVLHQLMIRCMRNHLTVEKCWQRGMILYVWNLHEVIIRMTDDESLRIDVYSTGEQRAYALFWALRKEIEEINYKLNLNSKEFILDGTNAFSLGSVLGAARSNSDLFDEDGNPYNAQKLLGSFYEESFVQTMRIENGSIVIPIAKRTYHKQKKSDPAFRHALYDAYNRICPYCSNPIPNIRDMQVDHILPATLPHNPEVKPYLDYLVSCGFEIENPDYIENYFPTHGYCNRDIGNRVDAFSLPYWHDIAAQHTPRVIALMEEYKKQSD